MERFYLYHTDSTNPVVKEVVTTLNVSYVGDITALQLLEATSVFLGRHVSFTVECVGDYMREFSSSEIDEERHSREFIDSLGGGLLWLLQIVKNNPQVL
jgi:hypothetical protein